MIPEPPDERDRGERISPDQARALAASLVEFLRPAVARMSGARTLSTGKFNILRHLAEEERASAAELAHLIRVSPQGVSVAVKELTEAGLIERHPDQTDRRRVWLRSTQQGRIALAEERARSHGWLIDAIETTWTPAQAAAVAESVTLLLGLVGVDPDAEHPT